MGVARGESTIDGGGDDEGRELKIAIQYEFLVARDGVRHWVYEPPVPGYLLSASTITAIFWSPPRAKSSG
ncbi:MAG: hypothetical protein ACR2LS_04700 [Thermomicrobiales bacterium]